VQVDEQQGGSAGALVDYVRVPEFFNDGAWHKGIAGRASFYYG
jgi:hypothetical protein